LRLVAAATALGALAGCASVNEPRVLAERVFAGQRLTVSLAPYADRPEAHPDIRDVEILVNPWLFGAEDEIADYRLTRSLGKVGPQQTVTLTAPPDASAIDVILTVDHAGDTFRVTVPFRYRRLPYTDCKRWIRGDEQLRKSLASP
jgi:hypothetical protein